MTEASTFREFPSCVAGVICLAAALACENPHPPTTSTTSAGANRGAALAATAVPACETDCFAMLREAISWVSRTRDVEPARLLIDSVAGAPSSRAEQGVLPRAVLDELTTSVEAAGRSSTRTMARCFSSPFVSIPPSCQPLADKIMVTLSAPVVSETDQTRASLEIVESWNAEPWPHGRRAWIRNGYTLTLKRATIGWRVVDAKLVFQT